MGKTGIAIFVYNRREHARESLESLRRNDIDKLYVFADGPKDEVDERKTESVRQLIECINWCQVEMVSSKCNKGLKESLIFGISYVLERHERIIMLEDDCIVTSGFIRFMEQCLDEYEDNEKVMNITGYSRPIKLPRDYPYGVYFTYRHGSHGQAFWKRTWDLFERDPDDFTRITNSKELRRKLDRAGKDLYHMFKCEIEGKIDSVGVWLSWSIIKNDGVSVNPVQSRVQDIGHDGSGTHGSMTNRYHVELKEGNGNEITRFPDEVVVNKKINKMFNEYAKGGLLERARRKSIRVSKRLLNMFYSGR